MGQNQKLLLLALRRRERLQTLDVFRDGLQGHLPQSINMSPPCLVRHKDFSHDRGGISRGCIVFLSCHLSSFFKAVLLQQRIKPVSVQRGLITRKARFEHQCPSCIEL
jgi:hypothetical protein